jgi:hypothetical protein
MTPAEYWTALQRHDWFHYFSDDARVERAGAARERELQALADSDAQLQPLFLLWTAWRLRVMDEGNVPQPVAPKGVAA